ncbi:hypothetical protein [Micromonospora sp. DT229]|uniref:hypothetical protein n=1 Tax=Micromonospora sp. DT229 TaxID=3393430 RepID=UPI003CF14BFC
MINKQPLRNIDQSCYRLPTITAIGISAKEEPALKRTGMRIAAAIGAVAMVLATTPGAAHAAQWNNISQTLNGTSWTTENYVRTVTTNGVDIILDLQNRPGCCLDLRLKRNSDGFIFATRSNMQANQNYTIATSVLANTRFNVEGRNSVSGTDRFWSGRLYY